MKNRQQTMEVKHWRRFAPMFDSISGWATPAGECRVNRRIGMVHNSINVSPRAKILELGCGTGIFTEQLVRNDNKIIAVDISQELIKIAKQKVKNQNVKFQIADIHNLPFPDYSFDVVVGISVLHHLDLGLALTEIYRVIKRDGNLILSEPNMLNPQIFLQKNIPVLKKIMKDTRMETAFFKWQVLRIFRNKGFRDISVIPFDFLHPLTPRILVTLVSQIGRFLETMPIIKEFAGSLFIIAQK